jgi:hypothetical protein
MTEEEVEKLYKERLSEVMSDYETSLKELEERARNLKEKVQGNTDQEKINKILEDL